MYNEDDRIGNMPPMNHPLCEQPLEIIGLFINSRQKESFGTKELKTMVKFNIYYINYY
jgi:hypothetical protein